MSLGFRVGVPGMRVRVSTRGVRASVGPRIARVHVGTGRTRVSSGMGPFYASTALSRSRGVSRGRSSTTRSGGPSPTQLARAQRAAQRAQQEAERNAAIEQLRQLRRDTTRAHLERFAISSAPIIPPPPPIPAEAVRAQAYSIYQQGLGLFARKEKERARVQADAAVAAYVDSESRRLAGIHAELCDGADAWWTALCANDEQTVCDAVNAAFADNPAAGCAVGVDGASLSVIMRLQDLDTLPDQMPSTTAAGRPTLKAMPKRERMLWWMHILASNLAATVLEALATAPSITEVNAAVITRMPDTHRLGLVAYGSWSRTAIERGPWGCADDAWRILDIGTDVQCSIRTTASGNISSVVKPLPLDELPGVATLLANCDDDGDAALADLDADLASSTPVSEPDPPNPFRLTPFDHWLQTRAAPPPAAPPAPTPIRSAPIAEPTPSPTPVTAAPQSPAPRPPAPQPPVPVADDLSAGQSVVIGDAAAIPLRITFTTAGADADLVFLLLDRDDKVLDDSAMIFYNQPVGDGVTLISKQHTGSATVELAVVRPGEVGPRVAKVLVAASIDADSGATFDSLGLCHIRIGAENQCWSFTPSPEPQVRALILVEIYLHRPPDAGARWKLRALGQGWDDGLAALARAYGVNVDG
ncbi:TerD family protein [Gordonia sp. VNQ95]|uniref:TerD family protein n=1 Tax=Gordonia sp. VNQ95 TaxID=3156619 RepID=UPI0032B47777